MKKVIIGFIVGILLCGVVSVSAYTLLAKDIAYKDTNVESALNDLYNKAESDNYDDKTYIRDGLAVYDNRITITDGGYYIDDNGIVWVNITFISNMDGTLPLMIISGLPKKVETPFVVTDTNNLIPFMVTYDAGPSFTTSYHNRIDCVSMNGYYSQVKPNTTYTLQFKY